MTAQTTAARATDSRAAAAARFLARRDIGFGAYAIDSGFYDGVNWLCD